MIAQFDGFEIHPIQEGDASTIHDFIIANTCLLYTSDAADE